MAIKYSKYIHKEICICPFCKAKKGELKGIYNPMYGKKHTVSSLEKMRQASSGDKNPAKRLHVRKKISLNTMGKNKGRVPWNKHLTKEIDDRVLRQAEHQKISRARQIIPTKDTSIEIKLQIALTHRNIIFEKHKSIIGQPDIFIEPNICIFADGDYWHNTEKSKLRDCYVNIELKKQNYIILRFWEHDINSNISECIDKIVSTTVNKII